jgi:SAM-dependent methyltransferase
MAKKTVDRQVITEQVKDFYNSTPFPNYDDIDSKDSLINKASLSWFARLLDEQIPLRAKILECGCGTGQLSNFLAIKDRDVVAGDLSESALKLGRDFADRNQIQTVRFVNMDLFSLPFEKGQFDLVISNGVLHHTADTRAAFNSIASQVKPGGYIIVGLYHRWGRLITDIRRIIFRALGQRMRFLDPNLRGAKEMTTKQYAWYNDQYQHPIESKHTIAELAEWYEEAGFDVINSIPDSRLFHSFSADSKLFSKQPQANKFERGVKEFLQFLHGSKEGGFFILIGKRSSQA